jgi:hypothetical protein
MIYVLGAGYALKSAFPTSSYIIFDESGVSLVSLVYLVSLV